MRRAIRLGVIAAAWVLATGGVTGCGRDGLPEPCVSGETRCEEGVFLRCLATAWDPVQSCVDSGLVCASEKGCVALEPRAPDSGAIDAGPGAVDVPCVPDCADGVCTDGCGVACDPQSVRVTCRTGGPCKDSVGVSCGAEGRLVCDYSAFPAFEDDESTCDGVDNDCDGTTDEKLAGTAFQRCGLVGVCENFVSVCSSGKWDCDFVGEQGYETVETLCDALDNDCDGDTDEPGALVPSGECLDKGVCTDAVTFACLEGQWSCAYDTEAYETVEATCDGLDNDCDGLLDEELLLAAAFCGPTSGVCTLVEPEVTCVGGQASCSFAHAPAFELTEKTCDGLDNDCDGEVDLGVSTSPALCLGFGIGVCKQLTSACTDGAVACLYGAVPGYAAEEANCDGQDNDCDGETDEGMPGGPVVCAQAVNCSVLDFGVCQV
ncbi:MAG: hypothetical protein ACI9WU_004957, partial [Myxococcota bacterium]